MYEQTRTSCYTTIKKINIYDFFEYVAGGNTFDFCKPDPRHITNMVEIMGGDIKVNYDWRQ